MACVETMGWLRICVLGSLLGAFGLLQGADAPMLLEPKKVLETLPDKLVRQLDERDDQGNEARRAAFKQFDDVYHDKPCMLQFKLLRVERERGQWQLVSRPERIRVKGTNFDFSYIVNLNEAENQKAFKLKAGEMVTATGLGMVHIVINGLPHLKLEVNDARLQ